MVSDPIKILIVDGDERVLIELDHLLGSEGYRATTWCGREALAFTDQMQFDILLVDEDMTHPNCAALVAELQRRQPRVLFLQMHSRKNHNNSSTIRKWEHPRGESDDSERPGCMKLRLDSLACCSEKNFHQDSRQAR